MGKWGLLPAPDGDDSKRQIFCDFASALHNVDVDLVGGTFTSHRVGDGELVQGTRTSAAA